MKGWPQSLQGNYLSILGLLDSPVNVVLNSKPGPGLENSFVGLGPSGAWLAPCAQDCRVSERLGGSKEVLLDWRTESRKSEPWLAAEDFRRFAPGTGFDPVAEQAGAVGNRAHLGGDE